MNRSDEEMCLRIDEVVSILKTLGLPYYIYFIEQVIFYLF